jgi:hypothetical protein
VAEDIVLLAVGIFLVGVSRWAADNLKVSGEHKGAAGSMLRMGGLYDNYASQLYRWVTFVLTGLVFIGIGVTGLLR